MVDFTLISIFINIFTCSMLSLLLLSFGGRYKYFALFNINLCVWSFFYGSYIVSGDENLALIYGRLTLFFIVFIPYLALKVSLEISGYEVRRSIMNLIKLAMTLLAIVSLTPLMVTSVGPFLNFNYVPRTTILCYVLIVYFGVIVVYVHFILFQSIKNNYKNRLIFTGFLIGFLGGSTNLLQYINIPVYPVGNFLISIYCTIASYALIKHRMHDKFVAIGHLVIKSIAVLILLSIYYPLVRVFNRFVEPGATTKMVFYFVFFVVSLEIYHFLVKKLEILKQKLGFSNIYNKTEIISRINDNILDVVDLDKLFANLRVILERRVKVKIRSFYVVNHVYAETKKAEEISYDRFYGKKIEEENLKALTDEISNNNKLKLSIKYNELDEELRILMDKIGCKGFVPFIFHNKTVGFMIVEPRKGKKSYFYYEDMEIFDDLVLKVGIALERVRLHLKFLFDRESSLKSLAGSIAHEIRNPLSSIRLSASNIVVDGRNLDSEHLKKMSKDELQKALMKESNEILLHKSHLFKSITLANNIIDMTLADLSGKKISEDDFVYIRAGEMTREAIDIFGFQDESQRLRVKIDIEKDFIFKASQTAFCYILFNLVKNSLYYVKDHPDLNIRITSRVNCKPPATNHNLDQSCIYNIVSVEDNGPGIQPDILNKLFGSFVTSGKKEGTGLGLAFCKRTMIDFGGDIDCESEFGKYTRFNLYFPHLSRPEIEEGNEVIQKMGSGEIADQLSYLKSKISIPKKVLIADDELINIKICQKFLNKHLDNNVVIDCGNNGQEAFDLFLENRRPKSELKISDFKGDLTYEEKAEKLKDFQYDLIITDIQMPQMDGFEMTKAIREIDHNIPIIAYTSRTSYKVKQDAMMVGIDNYVMKPIPNDNFTKSIHKWLINNHQYNYQLDSVANSLSGMKVLLADDEMVNLMVLKKFLTTFGLEVDIVTNGEELVNLYKSQFKIKKLKGFGIGENSYYQDPDLINKYDVIITDVNMPKVSGCDAVREIRHFELLYNIQNPAIIIANSGDGEEEKLLRFLKSGMDDYFIKGDDNIKMLKIIYYWKSSVNRNLRLNFLNVESKIHNITDLHDNNKIINSKLSKDELYELKDIFISSSQRLLENIKKAVKDKDLNKLSFESHALKGVSGNIGMEQLFLYISYINNYAKNGKWPNQEKWLTKLEEIINQTAEELNSL